MKRRKATPFLLLVYLLLAFCLLTLAQQGEVAYGPEVKAFLDLCRHEETELEYQLTHNEISRKDYTRSKNRIAIQRQMVLKRVRETQEDLVPDFHIVTTTEVSQLIETGIKAVKAAKVGDVLEKKWLYHGSANRGEIYYIFERVNDLANATRPRTVKRNSP